MSLSPCKTVSLHTFAEELISSMISSYHQCSPILTDFFLLNLSIIWKIVIIVKCSLNLRWCHLCLRVVTFAFPCWLASISGRAVWAGGPLARVILYPPNIHTHNRLCQAGNKKSHIRSLLCTSCLLSYFAPSVDASGEKIVVPHKLNFNKDIKAIQMCLTSAYCVSQQYVDVAAL